MILGRGDPAVTLGPSAPAMSWTGADPAVTLGRRDPAVSWASETGSSSGAMLGHGDHVASLG